MRLGRFLISAFLASSPIALCEEDPETKPSNFFAKIGSEARFAARPASDNAFAYPAIGLFDLRAGYQPLPELEFQVSAIARVPVQAANPHIDGFLDLYDSYLKFTQPEFVFTLGYIRTPWSVLRASALNDRLNPVDYRRGVDFPGDSSARIPQWGIKVTGQVKGFSLEGVYFFWRRPNPASFYFNEQDGVQVGRYQGALAKTAQDLDPLLPTHILQHEIPWFAEPSVGVAIRRQFGDFDTGLNAVWGFEEVPKLQAFASHLVLSPFRSLSFGGELSVTLGVVILKAEAVVTPKIADDIGKATLLRTPTTLSSQALNSATLAVGVDAEYGDALSGSLELIDTFWFGVPPGTYLHALEDASSATNAHRFVQRLALAMALEGKLFSNVLAWRFKGEVGLIRPDLLSTVDIEHHFRDSGFYAGIYANLFFGVDQSPGWYRYSATECGVKFGYRI